MNSYEQKHKKASFLGSLTHTQATKGEIKGSLIETAKDLGIGVIGGGIVAAAIGRASFLTGLLVTFAGHYSNQNLLRGFGFGMMAASGFPNKSSAVNGTEIGTLEGVKERVIAFKDSFSEKLFLDKIMKKDKTVKGFGEVQYFSYPANQPEPEMGRTLDLSPLDDILSKVEQSGKNYQTKMEMSGLFTEIDPREKLF